MRVWFESSKLSRIFELGDFESRVLWQLIFTSHHLPSIIEIHLLLSQKRHHSKRQNIVPPHFTLFPWELLFWNGKIPMSGRVSGYLSGSATGVRLILDFPKRVFINPNPLRTPISSQPQTLRFSWFFTAPFPPPLSTPFPIPAAAIRSSNGGERENPASAVNKSGESVSLPSLKEVWNLFSLKIWFIILCSFLLFDSKR